MKTLLTCGFALAAAVLAVPADAQITFYAGEGFHGPSFTTNGPIRNLDGSRFNDRASSAIVEHGRWEACEHAGFAGRCVILRPGQYPSLAALGMNDTISSVRPVQGHARVEEVPPPAVAQRYDYYPRHGERLFEANVTSVRAVTTTPARQRCWVEREQVVRDSGGTNVPGAIIGGVLGGVLGHQVGGGRGKDVATAVGAVGGAAVGANVGSGGGSQVVTQDVQRCAAVHEPVRPDYYDVTYLFRGVEHHVQMTTPPGRSITVNDRGEPRV